MGKRMAFSECKKYRYVRLIPARDTIALCEISFYEKGFELPIRDIRIAVEGETLVEGETPDALIDGFSATGWKGKLKKESRFCSIWEKSGISANVSWLLIHRLISLRNKISSFVIGITVGLLSTHGKITVRFI